MFLEVTLAEHLSGQKKTLNLMQIASIEPFQGAAKVIMHRGGGEVIYVKEKYEDLINLIVVEGLLIRLA